MGILYQLSDVFHVGNIQHGFFILLLVLWVYCSREDENLKVKTFFKKLSIIFESILFMVYSKDSKGIGPKYNPDPKAVLSSSSFQKKQIIFIRHGESDWNSIFNKRIDLSFPKRLFLALYNEICFLFEIDSIFLDSPLNHEGIEQALELRRFLDSSSVKCSKGTTQETLDILRGENFISSVIVTSTLRRSISTTILSLWPRIEKSNEKVHVLSSLQEISRNVDTRALSSPKSIANLPFERVAPYCKSAYRQVTEIFDGMFYNHSIIIELLHINNNNYYIKMLTNS